MKTFLNIIWYFPYFGFLLAIPTALVGAFFCLTVVGLPIGLGMFQVAKFLFYPNTHKLISKSDVKELRGEEQSLFWKVFNTIVRVLYFPVGLFLAVVYIIDAVVNFVTIIGIPNGLVIVRMLPAVFNPVNKVCVPDYVADHIQQNKEQDKLNKFINKNSRPVAQPVTQVPIHGMEATTSPGLSLPSEPTFVAAQPESKKIEGVSSYDWSQLEAILAAPTKYDPQLLARCRAEKELRLRAAAYLPKVKALPMEKIDEILANPTKYSAEIVCCCREFKKKKAAAHAAASSASR